MAESLIDPYAAIRTLNLTGPLSRRYQQYRVATTPTAEDPNAEAGYRWDFDAMQNAGVSNADMQALMSPSSDEWMLEGGLPEGFGTKYSNMRDLGDGRVQVTMQVPGGHKYDTMDVVYAPGADGQMMMQGDPTIGRQVSSMQSNFHDMVDAFAPMAAMATGGALYGAYGGGAGAGAGAAEAGSAGGMAAADSVYAGSSAGSIGGGGAAGGAGGAAAGGGLLNSGTAGQAAGAASGAASGGGSSGGGSSGSTTGGSDYWTQLQDWMRQNPTAGRAIAGLIGAGLTQTGGSSGGGGGYQDSGYRPTITRGGWSPTAQAQTSPPPAPQMLGTPGLLSSGQANDGLWRYRGLLGGR